MTNFSEWKVPPNPVSGDEIINWADEDKTPETIIEEFGEEMDGGEIEAVLVVIADSLGYNSLESYLADAPMLAWDIINATQSNPDKAWHHIHAIAILREVLDDTEGFDGNTEHKTRIRHRQRATDPYIPECSCGWEWDPCSSRDIALEALELHRNDSDTDIS